MRVKVLSIDLEKRTVDSEYGKIPLNACASPYHPISERNGQYYPISIDGFCQENDMVRILDRRLDATIVHYSPIGNITEVECFSLHRIAFGAIMRYIKSLDTHIL